MIKIICNRCGVDIDGQIGYIAWNIKPDVNGELLEENIFEKSHFCMKCMEEIKGFINNSEESKIVNVNIPVKDIKMMSDEQWQKLTEKSKTKKSRAKEANNGSNKAAGTKIDHGKIRALKNAGWSNKMIAEEMNMELKAVANSLYRHKE